MSDPPFHTVASDFSGTLGPPTGTGKYRYFVVFIDQLTKWPTVIPVKAPTTKQLIQAIEEHILPNMATWTPSSQTKVLLTRAKNSKHMQRTETFKQNLGAKGNHKANGLAENLIKQVHKVINKLAKANFSHWPKLLPMVEFNLRTAPHSDTGITTAMVLYGRELKKGVLELPNNTETALDEITEKRGKQPRRP